MTMSRETEHVGLHVNCGCEVTVFTVIVTASVHAASGAGSSADSLHAGALSVARTMASRSPPGLSVDGSLIRWTKKGRDSERHRPYAYLTALSRERALPFMERRDGGGAV